MTGCPCCSSSLVNSCPDEWNAEGGKVVGRGDTAHVCRWLAAEDRGGPTFDSELHETNARHRKAVGEAGCLDPGKLHDTAENGAAEVCRRNFGGVAAGWEAELHGQNMVGTEAWVDLHHMAKTAHQKARADEQDGGETDLSTTSWEIRRRE